MSAELYIVPSGSSLPVTKMLSKFVALLLFVPVLLVLLININQQAYPRIPDDLVFQRVDGLKQKFSEFKGKPLVVTFWSPNCVICMHEVKDFNRIYQQYSGGSQFELVALSMYYDRPDWVLDSSKKAGMTYPVYFDLQKNISRAFGNIVATPTSFLLGPEGRIIYRQAGRLDFQLLEQKLRLAIG